MRALGKGSIASLVRTGLTVAWYLLWVAAIGLVLGAIGYGVVLACVQAGVIDANILAGGDGQITVDSGDGEFHVTYNELAGITWPVVVPVFLIGGVAVAGALIIVWRLRRLFANFVSGEPFARANADHLRAIWVTMLGIEVARYLLLALTGALIAAFGGPLAEQTQFKLSVDLSTWGSILILIVLAEVFREGARLREEQELTI